MDSSKMKRILLSLGILLFCAYGAKAQESSSTQGLDERINEWIQPATSAVESVIFYSIPISSETSVPLVVILLLGAATIFTLYFRFVNIRRFGLAINTVRGKYSKADDHGEVSHFQALSAALSGPVGLGISQG